MSLMYRPRTWAGLAVVPALLHGATGCTVHTDDSPPPAEPTRVVHEYRTPRAPAPAVVYVHGHRADRVTAPPAGYNSCHGVRASRKVHSDFYDDEFVIYRTEQQRLEYLVEFAH